MTSLFSSNNPTRAGYEDSEWMAKGTRRGRCRVKWWEMGVSGWMWDVDVVYERDEGGTGDE